MFEIVFETRKHGVSADDPSPPLTSLVLESKFADAQEARSAIEGFQRPYDKRWQEPARDIFFAANEEEAKYALWYFRPVEG